MSKHKLKAYVTSYSEEVTGSNNHIKIDWKDGRTISFIIDCGLFQEKEHNHINFDKFIYRPSNADFAIATHVHTDHVGRFPYLARCGFDGKIYVTRETASLFKVVLSETLSRLEDEFRLSVKHYKSAKEKIKHLKSCCKKGRGKKDKPRREKKSKKGKEKIECPHMPTHIYNKEDIDAVLRQLEVKQYSETFSPCTGLEITFYPNAHIAGATVVVCRAFDDEEELYLLFTGDLGLTNPVTNAVTDVPVEVADKIDVIISESTYGSAEDTKKIDKERHKHMELIKDAYKKNGTIIYMSNALERPLRLAEDLKQMQEDPRISNEMQSFKIFFDSTFGVQCLKKYIKLYGKDYLPNNFNVIDKDSRDEFLSAEGPKMLICTSPRFHYGSFLNYGARYLEDSRVTMIFVAYVPDDVKNIIGLPFGAEIDFAGEKVKLRCKRQQFGYYSSHVSPAEMDEFMKQFKNARVMLFNHGTNDSKNNFCERYKTLSNVTHNLLYGRTVLVTKDSIEKYY